MAVNAILLNHKLPVRRTQSVDLIAIWEDLETLAKFWL